MRKSRVLAVLVTILLTWLLPGAVMAGPNADGAIIVHTDDAYEFDDAPCDYTMPATCEDAITEINTVLPSPGNCIWFLAAFAPTVSPDVATIYFGVNFDDTNLKIGSTAKGPCGEGIEIADSGWPSNTAGCTWAFSTPQTATLFPFYFFQVKPKSPPGPSGMYWSSAVNPKGGYAAFVDGNAEMDEVTQFGTVRWYEHGRNECPLQPVDIGWQDHDDPELQPPFSQEPFDVTLSLGQHRLWLLGAPVESAVLTLHFDGDTVWYKARPVAPERRSRDEASSASRLRHTYGKIPLIEAMLERGVPIAAAVEKWHARRDEVFNDAVAVFTRESRSNPDAAVDSALTLLETSGLIEDRTSAHPPTIDPVTRTIDLQFKGLPVGQLFPLRPIQPNPRTRPHADALHVITTVRGALSSTTPLLIIVSHGGLVSFPLLYTSGRQAERQMQYVRAGGSPGSMPTGPLTPNDPIIRSIIAQRGGGR